MNNKLEIKKAQDTLIDLSFKNGRPTLQINCSFSRTQLYSINLLTIIGDKEHPILLSFEHQQLQTIIDVTGVHNYLMAGFDAENKLIGVSFFNQMGTGTFSVLSQAKSVLIFPQEQFEFNVSQIQFFKIVRDGMI
tara:strand:- start:11 stop:415 length:405 start_codon:yes stop_codon:yes gene_type:complete